MLIDSALFMPWFFAKLANCWKVKCSIFRYIWRKNWSPSSKQSHTFQKISHSWIKYSLWFKRISFQWAISNKFWHIFTSLLWYPSWYCLWSTIYMECHRKWRILFMYGTKFCWLYVEKEHCFVAEGKLNKRKSKM